MRTFVVLCFLVRVTAADPSVDWDGTYTFDFNDGGELCPHSETPATVVVAKGTYSIAWKIRAGDDELVKVGTIDGTVRPSGQATVTPKLLEPMPPHAIAVLEQMDDNVDKLRAIAKDLHVRFESHSERTLHINTGGDCGAEWHADLAPDKPVKAEPVKKSPPSQVKPPPLPAGSGIWDMKYLRISRYSDDWRCPTGEGFKTITVAKGRFSFPYVVDAADGHGHGYGEMTIGQVEGSIAANGKVTMRTVVTAELPPEITEGRPAKETSLDYVRGFAFAGTFTANGKPHYGTITSDNHCELRFESSSTFKPGRSVAPSKGRIGAGCKRDRDCESDNCVAERCRHPGDHE